MTRERRGARQVVVITGARAGVGRATARAFAMRGARIGLVARDPQGLEATQNEVEALGGSAISLPADVADPEQVEAAAARTEEAFGPIEVWINNAMTTVFAPFLAITPDEFRRATEVTYLGTVHGTLAALRRMSARNKGTVVQVGSALAYRAIPLQAPYCGAKFAVRGFTDAIRSELRHAGSRVHLTMVQLPAVNTPQFDWCRNKLARRAQPVPPVFQPEAAARAIVWAADHRRREVYVGWPTMRAIVANKLFPGLADRYLARFGFEGQLSSEPASDGPDNLWAPVRADAGAHGRFDAIARDEAAVFGASSNRALAALVIASLGIAGIGLVVARRSGR